MIRDHRFTHEMIPSEWKNDRDVWATLLEQIGDGGRLIIPVGPDREQQLLRVTRRGDRLEREILGPVSFVPLLRGLI